MITPENSIPLDDQQNSEAEDQQSQKDIHSNGLGDTTELSEEDLEPNTDLLKQAFKASESSYTLDLGEEKPKD